MGFYLKKVQSSKYYGNSDYLDSGKISVTPVISKM